MTSAWNSFFFWWYPPFCQAVISVAHSNQTQLRFLKTLHLASFTFETDCCQKVSSLLGDSGGFLWDIISLQIWKSIHGSFSYVLSLNFSPAHRKHSANYVCRFYSENILNCDLCVFLVVLVPFHFSLLILLNFVFIECLTNHGSPRIFPKYHPLHSLQPLNQLVVFFWTQQSTQCRGTFSFVQIESRGKPGWFEHFLNQGGLIRSIVQQHNDSTNAILSSRLSS